MKKTILSIATCLMITWMIMPCNTFAASTKTIPAKSAMAISLSKQRYTKKWEKGNFGNKKFSKQNQTIRFQGHNNVSKRKIGIYLLGKGISILCYIKKAIFKKIFL
mgnify:CR=1 FL=1